jgi:antitoxin component HigA of HigAB toxin-antitoxin module
MNQFINKVILFAVLAITTQTIHAAPPSRQTLETFLQASGLDNSLKMMEQVIVTESIKGTKNASYDELNQVETEKLIDVLLKENLQDSFQYALLLDEITYFLKKKVSDKDLKTVLTWYQSDLGQRFVKADLATQTPKGQSAIRRQMKSLLSQQELVTMAKDVDNAIGMSDEMVNIQLNAQKALTLASLAIVAPGQDLSELENYDWKNIETADRQQLLAPIQQQVQANFVYAVKDFNSSERQQYQQFLKQPATVKVIRATMTGLGKSIEIGAHNFMSALMEDLKSPSPELEEIVRKINVTETGTNAHDTKLSSDW